MKKEKIIFVFLIGFLILAANQTAFMFWQDKTSDALENSLYSQLESIAESKAARIKFFLEQRENDLLFLENSEEVAQILAKNQTAETIEQLQIYQEANEYLDLIIISPTGELLYSNSNYETKIDLSSQEYNKTKLGKIFNKVQNDFGVGIYDPGYFGEEDTPSIYLTTPILQESKSISGKQEIIGIIALQIDNSQIEEKINEDFGIEIASTYLVNRDYTLMSSLEDTELETIETKIVEDCFQDYQNYYFQRAGQQIDEVEKSGEYKNYNDEKVFAAHQYILQTGWCVITEVNENEFYDSVSNNKTNKVILIVILIFAIIFFLIFQNFFKIKKVNKK